MTVLIVSRSAMSFSPYHEWLADLDDDLVLMTTPAKLDLPADRQRAALAAYAEVRCYDDFDSPLVEVDALEIARAEQVRAVVALSEYDLIRVAAVREAAGLPGQYVESAVAFRDKVEMKRRLNAAGVLTARYAPVASVLDVFAFVRDNPLPVVVKPRRGAGTVGVQILRDRAGLDAFVERGLSRRTEDVPDLMVESFVEGEQFHVDGIVVGGTVRLAWPSRYLTDPAGFGDWPGLRGVMLQGDDPLADRLVGLVGRALAALPTPSACTFHAEVFVTPQGELVLGEVASRTGGARINDTVRAAFGVNLNRSLVRAQVGLDPGFPDPLPQRPSPQRHAGYAMVAPRPGPVGRLPRTPPAPWVTSYRVEVADGAVLAAPASAVDAIASAVVTGGDEAQVRARIAEFDRWFWSAAGEAPAEQASVPA